MMESGAILLYLADKTGMLMPGDAKGRWKVMEWLMMQMGSVGPMLGQTHHFARFNEGKAPYAEERFLNETKRIYGVLNKRLGETAYLAGDDYTIADIATWPWISRYEWHRIDWADFPNLKRWYVAIAGRPAVQKGYDVPNKVQDIPVPGHGRTCSGHPRRSDQQLSSSRPPTIAQLEKTNAWWRCRLSGSATSQKRWKIAVASTVKTIRTRRRSRSRHRARS